jgi:hypothetical protein
MGAMLIDLADGVANLLRAGTFSREINVVRKYDTSQDLIDAGDGIRVDVVPAVDTLDIESRGSLRKEPAVDVAMRFRFGPEHRDSATGEIKDLEVDDLVALLEEILAYLVKRDNRRIDGLVWVKTEIKVPWHPDHLRQSGQYTGVARLTYRAGVASD